MGWHGPWWRGGKGWPLDGLGGRWWPSGCVAVSCGPQGVGYGGKLWPSGGGVVR